MAKTLAPAKTPTVAIARVLRSLGLKQGSDFSVKGEYKGGERIGTRVQVIGPDANQIVANNADRVERLAEEAGFHFSVSVDFSPSGIVWVWVANFGTRVRKTHFMSDIGRTAEAGTEQPEAEQPEAPARTMGEYLAERRAKTLPGVTLKVGTPRPAFGQPVPEAENPSVKALPHRPGVATLCPSCAEAGSAVCIERPAPFDPYEGLAKRHVGGRVWGCAEADQTWFYQTTEHGPRYTLRVYYGRARLNGWYLTGPGIASDLFMAGTLNDAAQSANGVITSLRSLTEAMEQVVLDFPEGQRVQGVDNKGVTCMGTVNGAGWGAVTQDGHPNYGRTWVDVTWDRMPHNVGVNRERPFASDLIKH